MKNIKFIVYLIVSNFLLWSCAQEVIDKYEPPVAENPPPAPTPTSGDADFSKYVAVGNSLTAGYMNGALYNAGQANSVAALLAKQFALAGGGAFNQPDINSENGFFGVAPDGTTILGRLRLSASTSRPAPIIPGEIPTPFTGDKSALNNFGVPGVTLLTALIPQTGGPNDPQNPAFNALYARFASNPGSSTIIGDAAAALANEGTFFTFWLGNNDVLGYAVGGASNPNILTSTENFEERYRLALGALLQASPEAEGMVANIPNVIDIPFFKTINPLAINVPVNLRDALGAGLDQLNAAITGWNNGVNNNAGLSDQQKQALLRPNLSKEFNKYPIVIFDPNLSDAQIPINEQGDMYTIPKIRNAKAEDGILLTLTAASDLLSTGAGINPILPINEAEHDRFYLTPEEQKEIQDRINAFNFIISTVVSENSSRIGLVDINGIFNQFAKTGFAGDNIFITSALAPPFGAFSLDGVHPNSRGYAYVANQFITAINEKFNATVPLINIATLPGNELPQ